ncbi:MAG: hypothetical protein KF838_04920 [Phycisphaeraceae bacterium]|nr:MAG: hypothetical protein KF838_04920 [Phycisphaeraceae bacterium]
MDVIGLGGHRDSPVREASTTVGGRTIKANRLRWFKSIGLSFWMRRTVGHAARVGALAADTFGQQFGDDVQSLGRREVIALDLLVGVDRHRCVRARARGQACVG